MSDRDFGRKKRIGLTMIALVERNEECLKMAAQTLNESRGEFVDFIYWEGLEDERRHRGNTFKTPSFDNACTVM